MLGLLTHYKFYNASPVLSTACQKFNIANLVYTSTYNVVFGGQMIRNGDETLPYLPLDKVRQSSPKLVAIINQDHVRELIFKIERMFLESATMCN